MAPRKRTTSKERRDKMRLRMDSKIPTTRISDPSLPAGRRREIDNVMKKARASANSDVYWDKRLLEVEAKDPNRWRHSGFKSLYVDESSPSPGHRSRSRSPPNRRPSRSPIHRRSLSPVSRRSPSSPNSRRYSRSPVGRRLSRSPNRRRTSPFRRSPNGRRSPPGGQRSASIRRSSIERRSPAGRRSPPNNRKQGRPHSPQSPPRHKGGRSPSGSSMSSCTDESCSVCSPRTRRRSRSCSRSVSPKPKASLKNGPVPKPRQRPPSRNVPPRRVPQPITTPAKKPQRPTVSDKPTDPRRQPPPPRPRNTSGEVINVPGIKPPMPTKKPIKKDKINQSVMPIKVKKERVAKRPGSPDSSASEDSATSASTIVATTCMTLSDRFGKMAQWSIDRGRDIENMRITKNSSGGDLKVMIEEDDFLYGGPPERYSHSPVPVGHYPDELLPAGPSGLAAWDDVRVRYQYYKDLGYLRDLSLDDYIKWEEWWYKYQEWLANERHYEHWSSTQRRRRKHRMPTAQRLS